MIPQILQFEPNRVWQEEVLPCPQSNAAHAQFAFGQDSYGDKNPEYRWTWKDDDKAAKAKYVGGNLNA